MAHNRVQGTKIRNKRNTAENTKKEYTGEWPSERQARNDGAVSKFHNRSEERNFNLVVDGVPYIIKSIPTRFNDDLRFRVIINDDTEHLFTWDSQIKMLRAIDDYASGLPDGLEEAISQKLQAQLK